MRTDYFQNDLQAQKQRRLEAWNYIANTCSHNMHDLEGYFLQPVRWNTVENLPIKKG